MSRLTEWAIPFVLFGPVVMAIGGSGEPVGLTIALVGALVLGLGCATTFRLLRDQGKEIERLRARVEQSSGVSPRPADA